MLEAHRTAKADAMEQTCAVIDDYEVLLEQQQRRLAEKSDATLQAALAAHEQTLRVAFEVEMVQLQEQQEQRNIELVAELQTWKLVNNHFLIGKRALLHVLIHH